MDIEATESACRTVQAEARVTRTGRFTDQAEERDRESACRTDQAKALEEVTTTPEAVSQVVARVEVTRPRTRQVPE